MAMNLTNAPSYDGVRATALCGHCGDEFQVACMEPTSGQRVSVPLLP
jgi:hypothetical protein